jgi:hypothetical protein
MAMRSGYEAYPLWADGTASGGVPLVSRRDWLCFGLLGTGAAVWPVRADIGGDAAIGGIFLIACAEPNPAEATSRWIIAIDAKTGTLTKLFDVGLYDGSVRVSPDGRTAAFEGGTHDRRAIMTCPPREGGKPTKVADLPRTTHDASPVTYELQPKNRATASARVVVLELVGKGRRVLTLPPGTTPRRPDWR